MEELLERLSKDVDAIRETNHRTGPKSDNPLRWVGLESPNGWRLMGDLANDIQDLISLCQQNTSTTT